MQGILIWFCDKPGTFSVYQPEQTQGSVVERLIVGLGEILCLRSGSTRPLWPNDHGPRRKSDLDGAIVHRLENVTMMYPTVDTKLDSSPGV